MKFMGRNKKNVLNQVVEEPKKVKSEGRVFEETEENEITVNVTEETINTLNEVHGLDAIEVAKEMASKEFNVPEKNVNVEISLKDSGEKLAKLKEKENLNVEKDDEKVVKETPRPAGIRSLDKETLKRLSHRERRFFERTGILPK